MRIAFAVFAAALLASPAAAQVIPPNPTTNDVVSYRVVLPATCPWESSAHIDGFHIDIIVVSPTSLCFSAFMHVDVPLGTLRAGTYTVTVTRSLGGASDTFTTSFVVTPAAAIPALDRSTFLALIAALGALGVLASRR